MSGGTKLQKYALGCRNAKLHALRRPHQPVGLKKQNLEVWLGNELPTEPSLDKCLNKDACITWTVGTALYFMLVTRSTVGYGDMKPITPLGQVTQL